MRLSTPWIGLIAATTAQTAVSVSEQGVPTLTAFVKQDLALSAAAAGALVAAIPAGKVLGSYLAGRAVDSIGERLVLVVGATAMGVVIMLSALAPIAGLAALLLGAGFFAATPTPAGGKLVLLAFPSHRRGLAMGIRQTGIPLGGLVAALALPALAGFWGWRTGLFAAGVLTIAGAGAALVVGGVETRAQRRAETAAARSGPSQRRLMVDRDILLLTAWGTLLVGGQYVLIAFLPVYLHEGGQISLTAATLFVAIAQVGAIVGRLLWGVMSDRLFGARRRPLLILITAVGIVSFVILSLLPPESPLALFALAAFLGGLSVVGWQGIFIMSIGEIAGPLRAGTATGFSLTFIAVGITVSPPLYGLLADSTGGFQAVWVALAIVVALALVPAVLVREPAVRAAALAAGRT